MSKKSEFSYFDSASNQVSTMKLFDVDSELDKIKSVIDTAFKKMETMLCGYTLSEVDAQVSFTAGNVIVFQAGGQVVLKFTKHETTKYTKTETTETDTT
jgi:hypothetical protein